MVSKFLNTIIIALNSIKCFINFHEWNYNKTYHNYEGLPFLGEKQKPCGFEMRSVISIINRECKCCGKNQYSLTNFSTIWHEGKPGKILKFLTI